MAKWVKPFPDKTITGHFGKIRTFRGAPTNPHRGTDYAPGRVPQIAVTSGTIKLIKWSNIMGWGIVYTGWADGKTWYVSHHHLACPTHKDKCNGKHDNPFSVKPGDKVTAGKPIAANVIIGSTGSASSGPHSHSCLSRTLTGAWSGKVYDLHAFILEQTPAAKTVTPKATEPKVIYACPHCKKELC